MAEKGRWERGIKNTTRDKVTSSSEVRTVWKNPLRDSNKPYYATLSVGRSVKVGVKFRF